MTRRRTLRAAAALAAVLSAASLAPISAAARTAKDDGSVTITVDNITPSAPAFTKTDKPLTFSLTVTSTTDYSDVRIDLERGSPISTERGLDAALADPTPPAAPDATPAPTHAVVIPDLRAGTSMQVTFPTTSSEQNGPGLCLCATAGIYPLFFSAHVLDNGADKLIGVGSTFVPSFWSTVGQPLHISWVWPLLERPHRLTGDTEFTDDLLAGSVGSGRLSRALQVVEQVAAQPGAIIPMTLLIDPELLDELAVMADAKTPYTVHTTDAKAVPGTGQEAARTWLDRLHTLLTDHPGIQVRLTPYADPDVEALTRAGLRWSVRMPGSTAMTARVTAALAGRALDTSVAWPAGGAISSPTLRALADRGVSTVLLNTTAVTPASAAAAGLARLAGTGGQNVDAALTSPTVERYVAKAITIGGAGAAALPDIIAELGVRVAQQWNANKAQSPSDVDQALTITPPRYVDPNVDAAVRTIEDTSNSTFAQPISLSDAVGGALVPVRTSRLARMSASTGNHEPLTLSAASDAAGKRAAIASLLDEKNDVPAQAYEAALPIAIQRCESAAWADPANGTAAGNYAEQLTTSVDGTLGGVHLVRPPSGSYNYTLASSSSPLPITVDNELPYAVWVHVGISTVPANLPGFHATDLGAQRVEPDQRHTFNIPTTTEHSGRIRLEAELRTPDGYPLGTDVGISVRNTALGLIGVVITIVAGVVLALALIWRFARRFRARHAPLPPPQPEPEPVVPEPVG